MKKLLPIAAAALVGFTGNAHASMLDIALGLTGSDVAYSSGRNVLIPDIILPGDPNLVFNDNSTVISPAASATNLYIQPTGPIFGNSYLVVLGFADPGRATYTLTVAPSHNVFGFTWGSIDDFNTLVLKDSRNVQYTITGSDVLTHIAGAVNHQSQSDITFTDPFGTITTAIFKSADNSFEIANLQDAPAVPLPSALPLLASAFLAMFIVARGKLGKAL